MHGELLGALHSWTAHSEPESQAPDSNVGRQLEERLRALGYLE